MGIDILSLTAQQKLDLAGALGPIKTSGGQITSPVAYFDVPLPIGFNFFMLYLNQVRCSDSDSLSAAFSADGGTTFVNDSSHFDSYGYYGLSIGTSLPAAGDPILMIKTNPADALMDTSFVIEPSNSQFTIWPGSDASLPYLEQHTVGLHGVKTASATHIMNQNPTGDPPATIRYNLLRFVPNGNGDCNPPTSGHTLTVASWLLVSIPG